MQMLVNECAFRSVSGGLGDFVVASARTGFFMPAQLTTPAITDGGLYHYRAESDDQSQHESGVGTYSAGSTTLARTGIYQSSNGGAKVNFSAAPTVRLMALAQDFPVSFRPILTSTATRFVRAGGNDSNDGLTSGTAWATLQHAMDLISMLDTAGFLTKVDIGPGLFAGVGLKSTVGGGIIYWVGAGVAATTIADGPNDGIFNQGEAFGCHVGLQSPIYVDQLTMTSASSIAIGLQAPCQFFTGNPAGGGDIGYIGTGNILVDMETAGAIFNDFANTVEISGTFSNFLINFGANVTTGFGTAYTINGNPTILSFFTVGGGGVSNHNISVSGTVNGPAFSVAPGGSLTAGGFPGSAGTVQPGGRFFNFSTGVEYGVDSFRQVPATAIVLANGLNSNIALPATGRCRITGPTGAFSLGGFAVPTDAEPDGTELKVYNASGQQMTIVNDDASSTAGNRIFTLTGANVVLRAGNSFATFSYDATSAGWVLESTN
jgi:hypothetical protein